jgi:hypothetical protein
MNHSKIFDEFVKIAQKEGLISEAGPAEHTEFDFPETNPRHDSLSIEQIGKLYNNKPDMPEDMKYKNNIMEDAHPDSLVISPSYDKLNGLVENEIEGQNIRLRIVMKEPDGHLVNRKYAEKQLILSLVRVANKLDNADNKSLCKLADVCLTQATSKKIVKSAQWAWALRLGLPLLAGLYLKEHTDFHPDGFIQDCQKAEAEIDDLINGGTTLGVYGHEYSADFETQMTKLKENLDNIKKVVEEQVIPVLNKVNNTDIAHDSEDLFKEMQAPQNQEIGQQVSAVITNFKAAIRANWTFISLMRRNLSNKEYQQRAVVSKGVLNEAIEGFPGLLGGYGLISNEFEDVVRSLATVYTDLVGLNKSLNDCVAAAKQKISGMESETESIVGTSTSTTAKSTDFGLPSLIPDKWKEYKAKYDARHQK